MVEWIYTAEYDSTQQLWDSANGARTEAVTNNVSEILFAVDEIEARSLAAQIAARYLASGRSLRNEHIAASQPVVRAAPAVVVEEGAPAHGRTIRCSRCGTVGVVGVGYPFSTLPQSGLCDDCV